MTLKKLMASRPCDDLELFRFNLAVSVSLTEFIDSYLRIVFHGKMPYIIHSTPKTIYGFIIRRSNNFIIFQALTDPNYKVVPGDLFNYVDLTIEPSGFNCDRTQEEQQDLYEEFWQRFNEVIERVK